MDHRWTCLAFVAALGGCGTEEDDRPLTLEGVTLTVLSPSCGQPQCHSTATRTEGLAFDTVGDSREALIDLELDLAVAANRPLETDLWNVITANGKERMPPDSPLASEDIAYIRRWLVAGAPGL